MLRIRRVTWRCCTWKSSALFFQILYLFLLFLLYMLLYKLIDLVRVIPTTLVLLFSKLWWAPFPLIGHDFSPNWRFHQLFQEVRISLSTARATTAPTWSQVEFFINDFVVIIIFETRFFFVILFFIVEIVCFLKLVLFIGFIKSLGFLFGFPKILFHFFLTSPRFLHPLFDTCHFLLELLLLFKGLLFITPTEILFLRTIRLLLRA